MKKILIYFLWTAAPLVAVNAHAALVSVTQNGDLMVSDSTLNVTWTDVSSGLLFWSNTGAPGSVQAWVANLNATDYGGYNNWMLPTGDGSATTGSCGLGCGLSTSATANQLGYLFFNELGNVPGAVGSNTGVFQHLAATGVYYWSGTIVPPQPGVTQLMWALESPSFGGAVMGQINDSNIYVSGLAVRAGATPVPLPAAAWLLLSGLGGLSASVRRRRAAYSDVIPALKRRQPAPGFSFPEWTFRCLKVASRIRRLRVIIAASRHTGQMSSVNSRLGVWGGHR